MKRPASVVLPAAILLFCCSIQTTTAQIFDYKKYLSGSPSTLSVLITSLNSSSGKVAFNGSETQPVVAPFSWEWGDGTTTSGFFPQEHTYADRTKNYVAKVTSHYAGGKTDFFEVSVQFQPLSSYAWPNAPTALAVTIPSVKPNLGTRLYPLPNLTVFDNSFFQVISRPTLEAILTVAAAVEMDFVNADVYLYQNKFQQVMLRDASFRGAYSLYFADPVAFGVGDALFRATPDFSSLFHEMGHNFTLNSPANYYYGGRIDGSANAIFTEAMAQIFQHAAGYEIVNKQAIYGLPDDLVFEIKSALVSSVQITRNFYERYLSSGKPFASWNNPNTPDDETLTTFGTIAFKFMEHAENSGKEYKAPLKRMMTLLQVFNADLHAQYDQQHNTAKADTFRATLMVTALSYAFDQDLRTEFRNLRFPISDVTYNLLLRMVGNSPPRVASVIPDTTLIVGSGNYVRRLDVPVPVFIDANNDSLSYRTSSSNTVIAGARIDYKTLIVEPKTPGRATISITADDGRGGTVATSFAVTVVAPNRAPTVANAIPEITLVIGAAYIRNLETTPKVFTDADGDVLTYAATSASDSVATIAVTGSILKISAITNGTTRITIKADDKRGGLAETGFGVVVQKFNYKKYLSGSPSTLSVFITSLNSSSGKVAFNGIETQTVVAPFSWEWGDGTTTSGFFPQEHTYADRTTSYVAKVTSHYAGGKNDFVEVSVRFQPLSPYAWANAPAAVAVTIPAVKPALGTRLYQPPDLSAFDNSFFQTISRQAAEAVLTVAAAVEMDFVNNDVYMFQNKFQQVMLRDAGFGGAYSIWYTDPIAFGVGDVFLRSIPDFSALFHEMGHNFTLNSPANYYYGGRIDGNANAIFSEAMAQIFQHAAGYEIVNNRAIYGLPDDLVFEIKNTLGSSAKTTRSFYEQYLSSGRPFASWNNPSTPNDETLPTFGTIAFKFLEQAENSGKEYRTSLKRMMTLLQVFNSDLHGQYDQQHNTAKADTFRATLMVTALSYAFEQDLRTEFRNLKFPVSDATYNLLLRMVGNSPPRVANVIPDTTLIVGGGNYVRRLDAPAPTFLDANGDSLSFRAASSNTAIAGVRIDSKTLLVEPKTPGKATISITADDGRGGTAQTSLIVTVVVPTGVANHSAAIPTEFALHQNYPNPFNPSTIIKYDVAQTEHVTLRVYDTNGRVIAVLLNERKAPGQYLISFDATGLHSGVYFYRLQAGSYSQTRKLILMR